MSSSTVRAQELANEANIQMTQETNATNQAIADAQNELNYKMFQEQNDWNLARRDEEWAYNDPTAQMERYMKAGINPLWAMSKGDPGTAQQLTSASPHPAVGASMMAPQVIPEYDPSRLSNIVAAAQNVSNSLQGFMKLGLESIDVDTRRSVGQSQVGLNRAEAIFKKAQTAGQEIFNNLNTDTYDILVGIKMRELDNLNQQIDNAKKQGDLTTELINNAKESRNQIIAMTNYTNTQANAKIQEVAQGWKRLSIDQQEANTNRLNAATNQFVAQSNSYYQGEQLKLAGQQFDFNKKKEIANLNMQSNKQITDWLNESRGAWEKIAGVNQYNGANLNEQVFIKLSAAGEVLYKRLVDDPTPSNFQSYSEYLKTVNSLPSAPARSLDVNSSNSSVLNPSDNWLP